MLRAYITVLADRALAEARMPQRRVHLDVAHLKPEVHIIKMAQGASDLFFRAWVQARVDGIVAEGNGGGNVNRPFYDGVCAAIDAGIPEVAGLRLPSGAPHAGKGYAGSFQSMLNKGALSAVFFEWTQGTHPADGGAGAHAGSQATAGHIQAGRRRLTTDNNQRREIGRAPPVSLEPADRAFSSARPLALQFPIAGK